MAYDKGCHTVFYHRYHIVWATKYRYAVLRGALRVRVREIIHQVCAELGVTIVKGVLSRDHVHMFVAVPPQLAVSELMRRVKGRSSRRIQQEFPALRKRYWGCHFWARGYFDHQRQHHRRRDTSVSRAAHRPTYRRQPVAV